MTAIADIQDSFAAALAEIDISSKQIVSHIPFFASLAIGHLVHSHRLTKHEPMISLT